MAIMYLSIENITCLIVHISLYLSVLKQLHIRKQYETNINSDSLVNSVDPDQLASKHVNS